MVQCSFILVIEIQYTFVYDTWKCTGLESSSAICNRGLREVNSMKLSRLTQYNIYNSLVTTYIHVLPMTECKKSQSSYTDTVTAIHVP